MTGTKKIIHSPFVIFCEKNAVMLIALLAAAVTCFIVPPDSACKEYFDVKTLACFFVFRQSFVRLKM